jgi:asparagine synthase (glutamine-hydrolysing)
MCGINGICNLNGPAPISLDVLTRMTNILHHRGPDATGIYLDDWVGLGHNRLSIIDLSGGSQPIHNEDGTLWIVYNGEVFNYPELREQLLANGHSFSTSTDTEVIVHLYEEKGSDCVHHLNGQYAFAIWDSGKKELFLARDRVGIRPLHYAVYKDRLVFASELKSILTIEEIARRIDPLSMDQIFTFWTTLPGRTVFQGLHELPPGHSLTVRDGKIAVRKYWEIPFHPPGEQIDWPVGKIVENVQDLLHDAIRIRLRADVPVGCYISGGLDSSGITSWVHRNFNNQLRTFGIRFEEKAFDESRYQDHMVSRLGTEHTDLLATNEWIGRAFPDVVWNCEKPLTRTAPVPLFLLSQVVRDNGFKVVLTGEGADEVFGGYDIFRETLVRKFWSRQPDSRFRPLLLRKLYPDIFVDPRLKNTLQSFFRKGIDQPDDAFFSHRIRWENTSRAKTFFSDDLRAAIGEYNGIEELRGDLPETFRSWDPLAKAQYLEMKVFLSNYLLSSQGDRVAMAHSVEIRLPFLDYRLIEFMGRVPSKWKIGGLREKYLLKKLFRGILPDMILARTKHPYRAPIQQSLVRESGGGSSGYLSDASLRATNLFDAEKVGRLLHRIQHTGRSTEVDGMAIAGILSSQIVHDQFVSRFPYRSPGREPPDLFIDRRTLPDHR